MKVGLSLSLAADYIALTQVCKCFLSVFLVFCDGLSQQLGWPVAPARVGGRRGLRDCNRFAVSLRAGSGF
jgi:hypothetical protein